MSKQSRIFRSLKRNLGLVKDSGVGNAGKSETRDRLSVRDTNRTQSPISKDTTAAEMNARGLQLLVPGTSGGTAQLEIIAIYGINGHLNGPGPMKTE